MRGNGSRARNPRMALEDGRPADGAMPRELRTSIPGVYRCGGVVGEEAFEGERGVRRLAARRQRSRPWTPPIVCIPGRLGVRW